jgi:ParB family chromosome partitioning protein
MFGLSPDLPRIIEVDLAKLRPNPDQPRTVFKEEALQELADSIKQHGLIQPIAVVHDGDKEGSFVIVAGERRFRAYQLLGRATIPAIITSGNPDEIALIENIQREDLSPIEEAEALAKMMNRHSYKQEELAKIIGKSRVTVTELLGLNTHPF